MTSHNRHNHTDTGFTFDREYFDKSRASLRKILSRPVVRKVKNVALGFAFLGFFAKDEVVQQYQKFSTNSSDVVMQKFTAFDAVNATLLADYGENYVVGKFPQLDIVADTARSSEGLKNGIAHLFGDKLSLDTIYKKRILSDEKLFTDLHRQALEGLRKDIDKESNRRVVSGQFILAPIRTPKISSKAGKRKSPGGVGSTNHGGVDYRGKAGTDVLAVTDAKVIRSFVSRQSIGTVILEGIDENGRSTGYRYHYLHVRPTARVGAVIEAGDKVTTIARRKEYGSNEPSTGDHLHFEIHKKTRWGWSRLSAAQMNAIAMAAVPVQGKKNGKGNLLNKFGDYVFNAVKESDDSNIAATLYGENERLYKEKKISRAEYNTRKKGLDALGQELYQRGLNLYAQGEHEFIQKLANYTVGIVDKENLKKEGVAHQAAPLKNAEEDNLIADYHANGMAAEALLGKRNASAAALSSSGNIMVPLAIYGYQENASSLLASASPLRNKVTELQQVKNELIDSSRYSNSEQDVATLYQRMIFAFGS